MRKFYILSGELRDLITDKDAEIAGALPYVASDWETFVVFYGSYSLYDAPNYDALIEQARQMCERARP